MTTDKSPPSGLPASFGAALRTHIESDFKALNAFRDSPLLSLVVELDGDKLADFRTHLSEVLTKRGIAYRWREAAGTGLAFLALGIEPANRRSQRDLLSAINWDAYAHRAELTLPLPVALTGAATTLRDTDRPYTEGKVLLGVIDDGCPFANWRFRNGQGTRVLAIWDQNQRNPVTIASPTGPQSFGRVPSDFSSAGLEFWRESVVLGGMLTLGLDAWIARHTHHGQVNEDGCYAEGGFNHRVPTAGVPPGLTRMAGLASHGSHVMDLASGRVPLSSRLARAGGPPPSWAPDTDVASQSDIVFVQIPETGVRDATGQWLQWSIVDGIEYIVSCAKPDHTKKVVVAISYGPTTGPHDGSSSLEQALCRLCNHYDGSGGRVELTIVLPAGNTWLTQNHVAFESAGPSAVTAWQWQVPPDNPVSSIAEVWLSGSAAGVTVTLQPPPGASGVGATVMPPAGGQTHWLLTLPPTRPTASDPQPAAHGIWTITVSGVAAGAQVHAYLARTDPNFGARTGAKASRFIDPEWERTQAAAAAHRYSNGMFDLGPSLVSREGTLNGMATNLHPRILVAAGWVLGNGQKAAYSSEGPARGTPPGRTGPDWALPTDETRIATGVPGAGNRGGAVFRLVGTSSAAPQLARHVANGFLPVSPVPPTPASWPQARGNGNLSAP